jgi:hypothetical protein
MDGREPVDYSDFAGDVGDIEVTSQHGSMLDVMRDRHQGSGSSGHSRSSTPSSTPSSQSAYGISSSTSTSSSMGIDHDYRRCPILRPNLVIIFLIERIVFKRKSLRFLKSELLKNPSLSSCTQHANQAHTPALCIERVAFSDLACFACGSSGRQRDSYSSRNDGGGSAGRNSGGYNYEFDSSYDSALQSRKRYALLYPSDVSCSVST